MGAVNPGRSHRLQAGLLVYLYHYNRTFSLATRFPDSARRRQLRFDCAPVGRSALRETNYQFPTPNPQSPIPNPQSPIPNSQSPPPNPQSPITNSQSPARPPPFDRLRGRPHRPSVISASVTARPRDCRVSAETVSGLSCGVWLRASHPKA